jgi:hypothetical protein
LHIRAEDFQADHLHETILHHSSILDLFWTGDDGIECGTPEISNLAIDMTNNKITFDVFPAAKAHSCKVRAMSCQVPFTQLADGTFLIPDSYVHHMGGGCDL